MMNLQAQNDVLFEIHKQRYSKRYLPGSVNPQGTTVINHVMAHLGGLFIKIGVRLTEYGDLKTATTSTAFVIEAK